MLGRTRLDQSVVGFFTFALMFSIVIFLLLQWFFRMEDPEPKTLKKVSNDSSLHRISTSLSSTNR